MLTINTVQQINSGAISTTTHKLHPVGAQLELESVDLVGAVVRSISNECNERLISGATHSRTILLLLLLLLIYS